jgi:hypothetical protein
MNDPIIDRARLERARSLLTERERLLAMPPEDALTRILNAPQPAALVHSFPEQDLHLLIRQVGPRDALPLLALASFRQLTYLLDVEIWDRDRPQPRAVTHWLDLIFRADAHRMISWVLEEKTLFVEWYLYKQLDMTLREHDQDPSEIPEGFVSFDETLYFRIRSLPRGESDGEEDPGYEKLVQAFVLKFLRRLAEHDYMAYHKLLLEAASVLPAEAEEQILRERNVRLAEKGFLPFEESVGVYQPIDAGRLKPLAAPYRRGAALAELQFTVPLYPMKLMEAGTLLQRALALVNDPAVAGRIQAELASLCNRIAVADQVTVGGPEDLTNLARKVHGYLNIGLAPLAGEGARAGRASEALVTYGLEQIFRLGYGRALKLKWRARRWLENSWFGTRRRTLAFWGEEWMGVLGGLLIKKPLYYDNYREGTLYREFRSTADIRRTADLLDEITAMDALLMVMDPCLPELSGDRLLTWESLLLTAWARHWLELGGETEPIAIRRFVPFFEALFGRGRTSGDSLPGKADAAMKTAFLNWLSTRCGQPAEKISADLGRSLEALFNELEEEYSRVSAENLDPRYVPHFLLK